MRNQEEDKHLVWAKMLAANPEVADIMRRARTDISRGLDEKEVKSHILERAKQKDFVAVRLMFPTVSRKVLRYPLKPFLHAIVDFYLKRTSCRRVKDAANKLLEKTGIDAWLVGWLYDWAATGEIGPMYEHFLGRVFDGTTGPEGEKMPYVGLVAGPASDTEELIEDFRVRCNQKFPAATRKRHKNLEEMARFALLFANERSDSEIAWEELERRHPGEIVHENPKYAKEHKREVQRVKQQRHRFVNWVTEIAEPVSPDSGT